MVQGNAVQFRYFSEILGRKVVDASNRPMGRLRDILAGLPEGEIPYPPVKGYVVGRSGTDLLLPADALDLESSQAGPLVSSSEAGPMPDSLAEKDFLVREMLLDKQIVDVQGAKVERVNDVHMLLSDKPWIVHVDVGFTGLLRRMGVESGMRRISKGLLRRDMKDDLVNWKMVQPLVESTGGGPIRLKIEQAQMKELHPGEMADILEDLDRDEQVAVVHSLGVEAAADVLEEAEDNVQKKVFTHLDAETAADIIEEMDPAEAVDILGALRDDQSKKIIAALEKDERAQIQELIEYHENSAGGMMSNEYLRLHPKSTAAQALDELRNLADDIDMIYYTYLVDGVGRLEGVVTIRELLKAGPEELLESLMSKRLVSVAPDMKAHEVAEVFQKYSFLACPVVDQGGKILGVISLRNTFDDLLPHFDTHAA